MPGKPLIPCSHGGCPNFKPCHIHSREYDRQRGNSAERGYDRRWRKIRLLQLAKEPTCRECRKGNMVVAATEVDHIIPRNKGGSDEESNLQSLCKHHHSEKTAREGGFGNGR